MPEEASTTTPVRRTVRVLCAVDRWPVALVAVAMLGAAALLFGLTHGRTFHSDEWDFVVRRQGNDLDTLLRPHNEHPVLLPLLLFKAGFHFFGLSVYWPYRVLLVAAHVTCAGLLFLVARRRVGDALAVVPAVLLLYFGPANEVLLWPFEISFIIPAAAGLGAILFLEREDRTGDRAACALLVLAFTSGSHGVPISAGIAVYLLFGPDRWRRLLRVLALPLALYALWLHHYVHRTVEWDNAARIPEFVARSATANLAALFGLGAAWGWALVAVLVIAAAVRMERDPSGSRWLLAALTVLLADWTLTAIFRPWTLPPPSRYLYVGGVFLLLAIVEVVRGVRLGGRQIAVAYVITAIVVAANLDDFEGGADRLRTVSDFVAPGLGAMEVARERVEPSFKPEPLLAGDVVAGLYLMAVDRFGSPATPAAEISKRPEEIRRASDAVLSNALRLRLVASDLPTGRGPPPQVERVRSGTVRARGRCVRFAPAASGGSLEVGIERGAVLRSVRGAGARVRLRRFAAGYGPDNVAPGQERFPQLRNLAVAFGIGMHRPVVLLLPDAEARALRLPPDSAPQPWHMRVQAKRPVVACAPRAAR